MWKPERGERYWYITFCENYTYVLCGNFDNNSGKDVIRIEFGNCFKTEELAKDAGVKMKEFLKVYHKKNSGV